MTKDLLTNRLLETQWIHVITQDSPIFKAACDK